MERKDIEEKIIKEMAFTYKHITLQMIERQKNQYLLPEETLIRLASKVLAATGLNFLMNFTETGKL